MDPSDAELMRRWQGGNAAAFESLVRRWQGPAARLLSRLSGPASAPDLCQEVFLRLYLAGSRYRESGAFSTWMYRIILNVARDSVRRRPQKPVSLDGHEPLEPSQPGDDLCRREAVRLVTLALADLPRPLREVLVLRHYEGLAFEEMTRLTGIPASTLKSRFAAALNRLRVRLQKLGYDPKDDTP